MQTHKLIALGLGPAILVCTTAAFPSAPTHPPAAVATTDSPAAFVSIRTHSDIYEPGVGVPILIEDAGSANTLCTSGANGQTEFVPSTLGATLVVTLGESPAPQGVLLGQQRVVTMPWSATPSDSTYLLHETTQPLAVPFKWPASDGGDSVSADPYHSRWTLRRTHQAPQTIAFDGLAAPLLTRREIDSTLAYNNAPETTDASDFRLGTLFRTAEVKLPIGAFTLEIDCRGHGFGAQPTASCIILAEQDDGSQPSLFAQVVGWDGAYARVWFTGAFEKGDNMVLLSRGPAEPTVRYVAKPPQLGGTTDAGGARPGRGGGATTDASQDCVPPQPEPPADWICDAPNVNSDPNCWPATNQGIYCDTSTTKVSDIACGSPGSTESVTTTRQCGFSLSVKFKIGPVEINPTGSYTDIESSTSTLGFGAGKHGCGECKAKYRHHILCVEVWDWEKRVATWSWTEWQWMYSCDLQREYSRCTDQMTTEGACSRTCN